MFLVVVSSIYFATGLFLLVATAAAVAPDLLGVRFALVGAVTGLITVYFIPQIILIGVAWTLIAAHLGALDRPLGIASLALHVACWGALAYHLLRIKRSLPILDGTPVKDGDNPFGEDGDTGVGPPAGIAWLPMITWRVAARKNARLIPGVVYREVRGRRLRADVYLPIEPPPEPLPALLYVHGGGWVMGTRRQSRFMMYELAARGFTVVAPSYRLAPRWPVSAAVEDVKAALAWTREHAEGHGADPKRIVVMGGSAGGHLAALLAMTPNDQELQPGFEDADTSVQGAVILYGYTDLTAAWDWSARSDVVRFMERVVVQKRWEKHEKVFRQLSPLHRVNKDAPPVLLIHGELDRLVPIEHTRRFAKALRDAGASRVHVVEVPGAHHAFEIFPTPLHQRAVRLIIAFLESVSRRRP